MHCVCIVEEPTAAALYKTYYLGFEKNQRKNLLVFDWGAGTLDTTLLKVENNFLDTLALDGNN